MRQGFVYHRVPHITLAAIANNTAIDDIWQQYQNDLEPRRARLNELCGTTFEEWEVPREPEAGWSKDARDVLDEWWQLRIARQRDIDASIAANADFEYLYDKPRVDRGKVRVAGPFTVESVSPHRMLAVDGVTDEVVSVKDDVEAEIDYVETILDNLKTSGVQQSDRRGRLTFSSLEAWPGESVIAAVGHYTVGSDDDDGGADGEVDGVGAGVDAGVDGSSGSSADGSADTRRAAVYIGPEFGTITRPDVVEAARAAAEAGIDVLVCCGFQYDAQTTEMSQHGSVRVLQARMNADLHMASDLKTDRRANLFVVFGEPDIAIVDVADGQVAVRINGVDVYDPTSGKVRSHGTDGIAMWFIDTEYDEECFFVRHAYFLGASDPYKNLRTTLKGEINDDAWSTLTRAESRPFAKPTTGRIAVKVINRLGDEVMKVFRVG